MTQPYPFRRTSEQAAYVVLHEQGHAAFENANPIWCSDLLNYWIESGIARLKWNDNGGFDVTTFKKYAYAKAPASAGGTR